MSIAQGGARPRTHSNDINWLEVVNLNELLKLTEVGWSRE